MKVIIVGGVAGGASAAARLRRLDEQAQIIVFEKSGYVSYANCGLPYYIGGTIEGQENLTLQTPESFRSRFRVDVRVLHEVVKIAPAEKTVTVKNLQTGEIFTESYDKLILSPGARPIRPNLPGIDSSKVFTLRTVEDTLKIHAFANQSSVRSAVVVGGGFIGVEMAENLRDLGKDVTLIELQSQILPPFDSDMVSFLHAHMREHGVKLMLGKGVSGFEEQGQQLTVHLQSGERLTTDMVIFAAGVAPDSTLAKDAGLKTGLRGAIVVNNKMETSHQDIYAVGDAVEVTHQVTGQPAVISLAGPANKQGRIAADNICGIHSHYKGSAGSSVLKVFEMTAAATGINERAAKEQNYNYEKIILAPASHAGYYPGGRVMVVKVLFEKSSGKLLGAQIVGFDGVDKRLDVLATAMQAGLSVTALKDLDLAYAPPYSSAKDPVNMVGFVGENILTGKVKQFYFEDLEALRSRSDVTLLDTRTDEEFAGGFAEGFDKHIPVDELRERLSELDKSKPVYVMCHSGLRSYIACRILSQHGFDSYNFAGGYFLCRCIQADRFGNYSTDCGL